MKRIFWDIEASDLNANWGTIFCIGYEVEGEGIQCISIMDFPGWEKEPWNDKKVIEAFLKVLNREDVGIEITHYGTNYDIPYLQARMSHHGLGVFPLLAHVDTYMIAKSKFAIKGKSLGSIAEFVGVRYKKTPLSPDTWRRAGRGDKAALDYVVKHCVADIRVLKAVHKILGPLQKRPPVIGSYGSCHQCGSSKLQKRGWATTVLVGPRQRFQCQNCGAWTQRKAS